MSPSTLQGKLLSYITSWVSADRSGYRNFILYVVSMAEYNIPHPEHEGITLLDESLMMMQVSILYYPIDVYKQQSTHVLSLNNFEDLAI